MENDERFPDAIPFTPRTEPTWATIIPGRRNGDFKIHPSLGRAKNAMMYNGGYDSVIACAIYKRQDTEWVKQAEFTENMTRLDARRLLASLS